MTRRSRIVCLAAMLLFLCAADARAFRPFDGTDATVADNGQLEIELGPPQYLREGSARSLIAPATVVQSHPAGRASSREILPTAFPARFRRHQ